MALCVLLNLVVLAGLQVQVVHYLLETQVVQGDPLSFGQGHFPLVVRQDLLGQGNLYLLEIQFDHCDLDLPCYLESQVHLKDLDHPSAHQSQAVLGHRVVLKN